jgi:hypothetical protein
MFGFRFVHDDDDADDDNNDDNDNDDDDDDKQMMMIMTVKPCLANLGCRRRLQGREMYSHQPRTFSREWICSCMK